MTTRERLHQLVDQLPESETEKAARFLEELADPLSRALERAPEDDEIVTAEDEQAIREGWEAYHRGEFRSHERIRREFGGRQAVPSRVP